METKTITLANGNTYNLLPASYYNVVMKTPLGMLYGIQMYCQINNCGYIVCHEKVNEFFGVYEPIDDEYELEEVYTALGK